jgi:hypothetical protein
MLFQSNTVRVIVSLFVIFLASGIPYVAADNAVISKLQDQATAGDANAQFELAEIYYKGEGVMKNYDTAFVWFEKAANQGHVESQHQMGHIYEYGVALVGKDNKKAFEWFHKAAEQGHMPAQSKVALMYMTGKGVKKSKENYTLWSNRLLEQKGLIETSGEKAAKAAKARRAAKAQRAAEAKVPVKPVSKPVITQPAVTAKPPAKPTVAAKPKRTPEEEKAWRREQAKRLVEEANKDAAAIGDWSEED